MRYAVEKDFNWFSTDLFSYPQIFVHGIKMFSTSICSAATPFDHCRSRMLYGSKRIPLTMAKSKGGPAPIYQFPLPFDPLGANLDAPLREMNLRKIGASVDATPTEVVISGS